MKKMIAVGLCTLAVSGMKINAAPAANGGDAKRGKTLVTTCQACHGEDGNSPAPNFPKLAGLGAKYIYKQLQDVKAKERVIPEMTGMLDAFSEQDMRDIAAYFGTNTMQLSGSEKKTVQINSGAKVDAIEWGKKIYRAGKLENGTPACSGCHSPTGQGNFLAGYPRLGGQHATYIAKQLRDFRAGNRINDGAMVMREVAKGLSDADIDALANYIAGLN